MNLNYKQKYLKYKLKYLTTKKMYGGSPETPEVPHSTPQAPHSTSQVPNSTPSAPRLSPASVLLSQESPREPNFLHLPELDLSGTMIPVPDPHLPQNPDILEVKAEIYLDNLSDNQSLPYDKPIFEKLSFGEKEYTTITLNTQHRPEAAGTYAEQIALHWNNNLASWNQEATRLKLHEQTLNVSPAELEEKQISTGNIENIYIMNNENEEIYDEQQNINNEIPDYDLLERNYLKIHINKNIF